MADRWVVTVNTLYRLHRLVYQVFIFGTLFTFHFKVNGYWARVFPLLIWFSIQVLYVSVTLENTVSSWQVGWISPCMCHLIVVWKLARKFLPNAEWGPLSEESLSEKIFLFPVLGCTFDFISMQHYFYLSLQILDTTSFSSSLELLPQTGFHQILALNQLLYSQNNLNKTSK